MCLCYFFFFKQKTAYEMRISDWSSDVCSSDLRKGEPVPSELGFERVEHNTRLDGRGAIDRIDRLDHGHALERQRDFAATCFGRAHPARHAALDNPRLAHLIAEAPDRPALLGRSPPHNPIAPHPVPPINPQPPRAPHPRP